ncbi:metal ABC transporter solute-binding protein, Zn/Mn family [Mycolicibacterium thermoresistibile]
MRAICAVVAVTAVSFGITACGQDQTADDGRAPTVVASTDVWGSVAEAVAGEQLPVTSIVTGPTLDPHSYEASPADAAALTDAALVVYNGGGYDRWATDVLAGRPEVPVVDAFALLPTDEPATNEHVFYHLGVASAVAESIADELAASDPDRADDYRANAAEFGRQAEEIAATARAIGEQHPDASVVSTEPVAYYLLANAGVADRTPAGFAVAVEEGDDPSPADVAAMLDLLETGEVSALLINPQTETPATRQIEAAAQQASVPVVTVTETLPENNDYLTWQRQTVDALADTLGQRAPADR